MPNTIMITGNLTRDPELRFTKNGTPVASFTIADTPRKKDPQTQQWVDGDALFLNCNVWQSMAENVDKTLTKGTRVTVTGKLKARVWETKEGEKRISFEIDVDEVAPSLKYATAHITRVTQGGRSQSQGGYGAQGGSFGSTGGFGDMSSTGGFGRAAGDDVEPPF